jgi:hypothetical protein
VDYPHSGEADSKIDGMGGFGQNVEADENALLVVEHVWTVHGHTLWQPVEQMRMGSEVMWGKETFVDNLCMQTRDG